MLNLIVCNVPQNIYRFTAKAQKLKESEALSIFFTVRIKTSKIKTTAGGEYLWAFQTFFNSASYKITFPEVRKAMSISDLGDTNTADFWKTM